MHSFFCVTQCHTLRLNPLVTNGLSHPYHLEESTFIFRGIRSNFSFLFIFSMEIKIANRIAPDGTPRFVASHLGIFRLPMSHKKDTRLILVNLACVNKLTANRICKMQIFRRNSYFRQDFQKLLTKPKYSVYTVYHSSSC